jgi:hypothetical protein
MIRLYPRPIMLMAGMISVLAAGCITGTNTFSSATVPATRYCSIDDAPAPVYDIPTAAKLSRMMYVSNEDRANRDNVSLVP